MQAEDSEVSNEKLTEHIFQEASTVSCPNKDCSISPTNEEIDEDPTYHQTLDAVSTLLGLSISEQLSEQLSSILG